MKSVTFIFLIFVSRIIVWVYNTVFMILWNHPNKVSNYFMCYTVPWSCSSAYGQQYYNVLIYYNFTTYFNKLGETPERFACQTQSYQPLYPITYQSPPLYRFLLNQLESNRHILVLLSKGNNKDRKQSKL